MNATAASQRALRRQALRFWRWDIVGGGRRRAQGQIIVRGAPEPAGNENLSRFIASQDRTRGGVIMRLAQDHLAVRADDGVSEGARSGLEQEMKIVLFVQLRFRLAERNERG